VSDDGQEDWPELPVKGRLPLLRRLAREWAMQALYQRDQQPNTHLHDLIPVWGRAARNCGYKLTETDRATVEQRAEKLVDGVTDIQPQIDALITGAAENWTLPRMAVIDRNVMRVAVYEMCHDADVPVAVAIDEALEIVKEYGDDSSSRFINGVLDRINRENNPKQDQAS
jgi:N utilization substance protein B